MNLECVVLCKELFVYLTYHGFKSCGWRGLETNSFCINLFIYLFILLKGYVLFKLYGYWFSILKNRHHISPRKTKDAQSLSDIVLKFRVSVDDRILTLVVRMYDLPPRSPPG